MDNHELSIFIYTLLHPNTPLLKYTYDILPLSNCPLSLGNGQLSKLHVNKAHLYLHVQKENAQCLSTYIIFWLGCILSQRKSTYLSIPEKKWDSGPKGASSPLFFRNGQIRGLSPLHNLCLVLSCVAKSLCKFYHKTVAFWAVGLRYHPCPTLPFAYFL